MVEEPHLQVLVILEVLVVVDLDLGQLVDWEILHQYLHHKEILEVMEQVHHFPQKVVVEEDQDLLVKQQYLEEVLVDWELL